MKIKDFIIAVENLNNTTQEIQIGDETLKITYSVIFSIINVRVLYKNNFHVFGLRVNKLGELVLDLTEDRNLINKIPKEIYYEIINKIFNLEV